MAEYAQLKAAINAVIKQNGRMEITGEVLNQVLTAMVNSLGRSMGCAGVATPATNPQSPDQNLFYFAVQAGTYVNFNSIVLPAGISVLMWNGTWTAQTWFIIKDAPEYQSTDFISAGGVFESQKVDGNAYDISEHFPTGGVNNTNEYTLQGALAKIPANMYKAGMAIKFKESTTHNYMVFTHVGSDTTNFTSVNLWQSVANSNELFHSPTAFMRKQIPTIGAVLDEFGTQSVQTLPTPSNATMNRIFVVQSKHPETDNIKTEWITIKVGNTYQWECIGGDTTGIYDLSDAMAIGGEPATYSSLSDALAAVPADKKRAGMTLAFIGLYSDMYSLSSYEDSVAPTSNAVQVEEIYLYGNGNYLLSDLQRMFDGIGGASINYPTQVGHQLYLYCFNSTTGNFKIFVVRLLQNQRIYEQYRFVGTDIAEFADESLWTKETKIPTNNNVITNSRNYVTEASLANIKPNLENMQNVTWAELVELRDNVELVAGKFYRITDYLTTTSQDNTQSAEHQFDVIVMALSDGKLSERAWAINNENDTYFSEAGAKLEAWQLWYCLDNDTGRFAWADTQNGTGVIYRMIDEFCNDCPYDFKNIMFSRCKCDYKGITGIYFAIVGLNVGKSAQHLTNQDDNDAQYLYTFNKIENGENIDGSLVGELVNKNKIFAIMPDDETIVLNNIVIFAAYESIKDNTIEQSRDITILSSNSVVLCKAERSYFGAISLSSMKSSYIGNCNLECYIEGVDADMAYMSYVDSISYLDTVSFKNAYISNVSFQSNETLHVSFFSADINNVEFLYDLSYTKFDNCKMTQVVFKSEDTATIENSDFSAAFIKNVNFYGGIKNCCFRCAEIEECELFDYMEQCTFTYLKYVDINEGSTNRNLQQLGKCQGEANAHATPSISSHDYVQYLTCDDNGTIIIVAPFI